MINLALVLVHNRSTAANRNQVTAIASLVEPHYVGGAGTADDHTSVYYTLAGLAIEHVVRFYQVVPFGVNRPSTMMNLDSHNVIYGAGDADKVGTHQRFRNWGIKRACDYGADIVAVVTDHALFTVAGLAFQINRLIDRRLLVIPTWGLAVSSRLFPLIGQFREDQDAAGALVDLRARIAAAGWETD